MDGLLARVIAATEFGKNTPTSDMLAFGVAPASLAALLMLVGAQNVPFVVTFVYIFNCCAGGSI